MRTLLLALATSATVFVTGVTEVAAGDYRYCIQGEEFAGGAGDCSFASYQQCQATASVLLIILLVRASATPKAIGLFGQDLALMRSDLNDSLRRGREETATSGSRTMRPSCCADYLLTGQYRLSE